MSPETRESKRTPLFAVHQEEGAKLVDFAGWEMPVEYEGIIAEHRTVRERAGLFDVSHMGELEITGSEALMLLQRVIANDASRLTIGQALYTPICHPDGGTVDDVLVYRLGETHYMMVPNAANIAKDYAWVMDAARGLSDVQVRNRSEDWALLALQGPRAVEILAPLSDEDPGALKRFRCQTGTVAGVRALVSRTGYTGEDGFELYCASEDAVTLWRALRAAGRDAGLSLCGLGARDTLRLEAALPLYGHELSDSINPLEAGLRPFVKLDKGDFIGRDALRAIESQGPARALIGLKMTGRGIARAGYPVVSGGQTIGEVTSGSYAPSLEQNIALALVAALPAAGDEIAVQIRGRDVAAEVVTLPFYRRS